MGRFTGDYNGIQGYTRDYEGIHGFTGEKHKFKFLYMIHFNNLKTVSSTFQDLDFDGS